MLRESIFDEAFDEAQRFRAASGRNLNAEAIHKKSKFSLFGFLGEIHVLCPEAIVTYCEFGQKRGFIQKYISENIFDEARRFSAAGGRNLPQGAKL